MKFYHVSYENLGESPVLVPRIPESETPKEKACQVPRVCVAQRISDCLRMFAWKDYRQKVHVYEVEVRSVPKASRNLPRKYVPDWKKYGREEVWLLKKEGYQFKRIGYARMFRIWMMAGARFWGWSRGGIQIGPFEDQGWLDAGAFKEVRTQELLIQAQGRKFVQDMKAKRKAVS